MTLREKILALKPEQVMEISYGDRIYSVCKSLAYSNEFEFWHSYYDYGSWDSEILAIKNDVDDLLWEMAKQPGHLVMALCEMEVVDKPIVDLEYRKELAKE